MNEVIELGETHRVEVSDVLCDAFAAYPVMRFVLGDQYTQPELLRCLIDLFVANRWMRGHPMLGVRDSRGQLAAVITLTPPGDHAVPAELPALSAATWNFLGTAAQKRYDIMKAAWSGMPSADPTWHVNMLGVRGSCKGLGHGDLLLRAALRIAADDKHTSAIDLTTEDAANLPFYQARGFMVTGHASVVDGPDTWLLNAQGAS